MAAKGILPKNAPGTVQEGLRQHRATLWLVLVLALLGFGIRVWRLGYQSLWLDEGLSVLFSSRPPEQLLQTLVTDDIHPPFYYLALHYWMALTGSSEFAVRFLSVAAGFLAVPAMYVLARSLLSIGDEERIPAAPWAGALAAAMVAFSPFLLYYSQETRNYMMVTLWGLLASLALWKGEEARLATTRAATRLRWWLAYVLLAALTIYTHYFGAFIILFHLFYLAVMAIRYRRVPIPGLLSLAGVLALYIPWVNGGILQLIRLRTTPDYWSGVITIQTMVERLFVAFSLGLRTQGVTLALAAFAFLFGLGIVSLVKTKGAPLRRGEIFLILYLLVPLLAVYLVSARSPKFTERYLIIIAPAFYLMLARGLTYLYTKGLALGNTRRFLGRAALSLSALTALSVLGVSGYTVQRVLYDPAFQRDDHRAAVRYIQRNSQPGDVIALMMNTYQSFLYYYKGDLPWYGLQPGDDFAVAASALNQIAQGRERLWLLLWNMEWADPAGFVRDSLDEAAPRALPDRQFNGVEVRAYSLAGRPRFTSDFNPRRPLKLNFDNKLELLGYDPPSGEAISGQETTLTLYWKALVPLTEDYVVSLRLKRGGYYWGHREARPTNYYYPTTSWRINAPIRGKMVLDPQAGAPPGEYQAELAVHSVRQSGLGKDLAVLNPAGAPGGTSAIIGTIKLGRARKPPTPADLGLGQAQPTSFDGGLTLLGGETPATTVRPGDRVPLTIFWKAHRKPQEAYRVRLYLEDSAGEALPLTESYPLDDTYPTDQWEAGEVVRDQYAFAVPVEAAPGRAALRVALLGPKGDASQSVAVAFLDIRERIRIMERPAGIQYPLESRLGDTSLLVGYSLSGETARPGDAFRLVLFWQSLGRPKSSYTVFTHLLDSRDKMWAQKDSLPMNGTYPTTAWIAGEYIRDEYELAVKPDTTPGEYLLEVGMYHQPTGQRLPLLDEAGRKIDDRIVLRKIRIGP